MTETGKSMGGRGAAAGRPLLLVIGTGGQDYREYLLRSISTGYRIHLFLGAEPTWERGYLAGWTVLQDMAETISGAEMSAAALELAAREPVGGGRVAGAAAGVGGGGAGGRGPELGRGEGPAEREGCRRSRAARGRPRHDHAMPRQAPDPGGAQRGRRAPGSFDSGGHGG